MKAGVHQVLVHAVCAHDEEVLAAQVQVPSVTRESDLARPAAMAGAAVIVMHAAASEAATTSVRSADPARLMPVLLDIDDLAIGPGRC